MRIISEAAIREFISKKPEAENAMREWIRTARSADWNNFSELKKTFSASDSYKKNVVIFDVGGNKYRIIGKLAYRIKVIFIRFVLTHAEYDYKNGQKWKPDCD